jgi:tRNA dimethylallyltransferase
MPIHESLSAQARPRVCLIGGPTAVGKTAVAVELAHRWGSEIVSADSMQVYRGLSVGTAKPSTEDTRGIPYHLVDIVDLPREDQVGALRPFSAAEFLNLAAPILDRLLAAGKTPIVVGGTGLYLRVLIQGLFEQSTIDEQTRAAVQEAVTSDPAQAYRRLTRIDPTAAEGIHPNDRVRVARALEVYEATGQTITHLREEGRRRPPRYDCVLSVLNASRPWLYERMNQRARVMFDNGLIEETQGLMRMGALSESYVERVHWLRALGYRFVVDHLEGRMDSEAALAAVQQSHRNYAKRQLTWFRKMKGAQWISVEGLTCGEVADRVEKNLEPHGADGP